MFTRGVRVAGPAGNELRPMCLSMSYPDRTPVNKAVDARPRRRAWSTSPQLEWKVEDEGPLWDGAPSASTVDERLTPPTNHQAKVLNRLAGLIAVCVLVAAFTLWQTAKTHLSESITGDETHNEQSHAAGAVSSAAPTVSAGHGVAETRTLSFHGPIISMEIRDLETGPDGSPQHIRRRAFFRNTQAGWTLVPPAAAYLGPPMTHTVDDFTLRYRGMDHETVLQVAEDLVRYDRTIRSLYGAPAAEGSRTIELMWDPSSNNAIACRSRAAICVPSPALARLPVDVSAEEALRLWLLDALVQQIHSDSAGSVVAGEWQIGMYALSRVAFRMHSSRLEAWHRDLSRWVYAVPNQAPRPHAQELSAELAQLCRTHAILAHTSFIVEASILPLCLEPPMWRLAGDLEHLARYARLPRLNDLVVFDDASITSEVGWLHVLAFETVFDYVGAAYGPEAVTLLAQGFRAHRSWTPLLDQLFGVSPAEFEKAWHDYLTGLN